MPGPQLPETFSEGQKAVIREIAYEVGRALSDQIQRDRNSDLREHQLRCENRALLLNQQNATAAWRVWADRIWNVLVAIVLALIGLKLAGCA